MPCILKRFDGRALRYQSYLLVEELLLLEEELLPVLLEDPVDPVEEVVPDVELLFLEEEVLPVLLEPVEELPVEEVVPVEELLLLEEELLPVEPVEELPVEEEELLSEDELVPVEELLLSEEEVLPVLLEPVEELPVEEEELLPVEPVEELLPEELLFDDEVVPVLEVVDFVDDDFDDELPHPTALTVITPIMHKIMALLANAFFLSAFFVSLVFCVFFIIMSLLSICAGTANNYCTSP